MRNIVILTAKGGNTSVQNKNVIPVLGTPVMLFPLRAAKMSSRVDMVFVSTEDELIRNLAIKEGVEIIDRPSELSEPESQHKDVIAHAVREVEKLHPEAENFVVLLGNTVQVTAQVIDQCLEMLDEEECDSVATVWRAQDDHPYRAMCVASDGYARPFMKVEAGSNRQSYPPVFYYDQGVWAFKKHCAFEQKGPRPWLWLGEKCRLVERPWVTGRDIHTWIDVSASAWYLGSIQCMDLESGEVVKD
jgi:CMP-N-acetylneuraminic acid synthetase